MNDLTQQTMFPVASRITDPETSRKAERAHTKLGTRSKRAKQVLDLLHFHPDATAGELSRAMLSRHPDLPFTVCAETPHKRLSDLRSLGLAEKGVNRQCLDSGQLRATWHLTAQGYTEYYSHKFIA